MSASNKIQHVVAGVILSTLLVSSAVLARNDTRQATADFVLSDGNRAGTATLTEAPGGVLIRLDLHSLPSGEHALHIHETGRCRPLEKKGENGTADSFSEAGSHLNPGDRGHGLLDEELPHAGDMPNIAVPDNGKTVLEVFNSMVSLHGETRQPQDLRAVLLDSDGAAIVIHEGTDDYKTGPSGDAGSRIACGVIRRGAL